MTPRPVQFDPAAKQDFRDIRRLITSRDGPERALRVLRAIEAFCRSLGDFPHIGTRHDDQWPGLRTVSVPRLRRVTVVFVVRPSHVVVFRVGYLGRNVISHLIGEE
jgi:plasmid stabilization system protein ParE